MPVREGPPQPPPPKMAPVDGPAAYSAEKVRGAQSVLRMPAQRAIFIAGLAGIFVLVLLLGMLA